MNVTRRTPLLLDAFLIEFRCFSIYEVVGDVPVAVVRARIDIENLLRRRSAGKVRVEFVRAREPRTHRQVAADICKRILERVGVPNTDAVAILQTIDGPLCQRLRVGSQQVEMTFVEAL